jgi:hypothetical protein
MAEPGLHTNEWYSREIQHVAEAGSVIGPAHEERLRLLLSPIDDVAQLPFVRLKRLAQSIDYMLSRNFGTRTFQDPWIVLDDQRRVLTFLGVNIPFNHFPHLGGLKILRVLMRCAGTSLSGSQIVEQAEISVEAEQIKSYISRLRRVLRATSNRWPHAFQNGQLCELAKAGFIVSDRRAKPGSFYRLALRPSNVVYFAQ